VIMALDGEPVDTGDDLLRLLGRRKAGEQVRLEILRDGQIREVTVKLEAVQ
jgi:S1-C subfamily serine protease